MAEKAMDGAGLAIGDRLDELEERFRRWREGRQRGDRIPPQLWEAAADVAREHGVPRVAHRLRLNAAGLHKRLESAVGDAPGELTEPEFVELLTVPAAAATEASTSSVHECVVELHNARGARMRVELNAGGLAGLTHLCRAFWGAA
jgi:hypothetical protein